MKSSIRHWRHHPYCLLPCIFLISFQLSVWTAAAGTGTNGFGPPQSFFAGIPVSTNTLTPPLKFPSAFNPQVQISTPDIDGDGKPDLAFFLNFGVSLSKVGDTAAIVLLRNSSSPGGILNFDAPLEILRITNTLPILPTLNTPLALYVDLNQDGRAELLLSTPTGAMLWQNHSQIGEISSNTFTTNLILNAGNGLTRMFASDLDGDGRTDLVFAGTNIVILPNITSVGGLVTFGAPVTLTNNAGASGGVLLDADSDGRFDLLTVVGSNTAWVKNLSSPGVFSFAAPAVIAEGTSVFYSQFVELTGDEHPDLASFSLFRSSRIPEWLSLEANLSQPGQLRFSGSAQFIFEPPLITNPFPFPRISSAETAQLLTDLDGDGRADLIYGKMTGLAFRQNRVIAIGDSIEMKFGDESVFGLTNIITALAASDLNGDGKPDLIFSSSGSSNIWVMTNRLDLVPQVFVGVPQAAKRLLPGTEVNVDAAAFIPNFERLEVYEDGMLILTSSGNRVSLAVTLPAAGTNVFICKAFSSDGQMFTGTPFSVLVVDQLDIALQPRQLAVEGASSSSYVIETNGQLVAWGNNSFGQLGDGGEAQPVQNTPLQIQAPAGVMGWASIAGGNTHVLAISSEGRVYGAGNNAQNQLSFETNTLLHTNLFVPINLPDGVRWKQIAAGFFHSLALSENGDLYAWGQNESGQLGLGHTNNLALPTLVTPPGPTLRWTSIAAGAYFSLASTSDGNLYAWGNNWAGQLGTGDTNTVWRPARVLFSARDLPIKQIAAGYNHALAITAEGLLYSWGYNGLRVLGYGDSATNFPRAVTTPQPVAVQHDWKSISAGPSHSLALDTEGQIYAWGDSLALGVPFDANVPTLVPAPRPGTNWIAATSAASHTIAIASDNHVYTWGENFQGQLGDGSATYFQETPSLICSLDAVCPEVTNLPPIVKITAPLVGDLFPPSGLVNFSANASDPDGLVEQIEFLGVFSASRFSYTDPEVTNSLGIANNGFLSVSNLPPNLTRLIARATDNSGASSEAWISIQMPSIISGFGSMRTNSFTGNFEFAMAYHNFSAFTLPGLRLTITNLPVGLNAVNASQMVNGLPVFDYSYPVAPSASVRLTVELQGGPLPQSFRPSGDITILDFPPPILSRGISQTISNWSFSANGFGLAFQAEPGSAYVIQYSDNLIDWLDAGNPIADGPGLIRWSDNGPPKTRTFPTLLPQRFYRVIERTPK